MPDVQFRRGPYPKKYTAVLPSGKFVHFGDRRYQHYKDQTPLRLYKHLDHNDKRRRKNYRTRHRGVLLKNGTPAYKKKYTPAWFSYYYLW